VSQPLLLRGAGSLADTDAALGLTCLPASLRLPALSRSLGAAHPVQQVDVGTWQRPTNSTLGQVMQRQLGQHHPAACRAWQQTSVHSRLVGCLLFAQQLPDACTRRAQRCPGYVDLPSIQGHTHNPKAASTDAVLLLPVQVVKQMRRGQRAGHQRRVEVGLASSDWEAAAPALVGHLDLAAAAAPQQQQGGLRVRGPAGGVRVCSRQMYAWVLQRGKKQNVWAGG
jgi:hypothetical protein